jgi:hypothetical protein
MSAPALHRRALLRTSALAATAGLLPACGSGGGGADVPPPEEQTLAVQAASLEFLTGRGRYLAFGVTGVDRSPLPEDAEVEVLLRTLPGQPDQEPEVVLGPLPATYSPAGDTGQAVYYLQADLEEPGLFELVARSGGETGTAAVQVVDPQDSQVKAAESGEPLIPGAMAVPAATPTEEDDLGVFAVCTQDPPCGMHEQSLDEALGSGKPVVLIFATPQFCQTVVCGPSVATLDAVRQDGDWGETVFVHSEIFQEEPTGGDVASTPLTPAVEAWGLPTEPWLFTIGPDGTIVDRIDGPMPEPVVRSLVEGLQA